MLLQWPALPGLNPERTAPGTSTPFKFSVNSWGVCFITQRLFDVKKIQLLMDKSSPIPGIGSGVSIFPPK